MEVVYRSGLRTALGIRTSINNEIVYIEADRFPLLCKIKKQQLKFWLHVKDYMNKHPKSALETFVLKAMEVNLSYVNYYRDLERTNNSPENCLLHFQTKFKEQWKLRFEAARSDTDSRLGCYLNVNPSLSKPLYHTNLLLETDRLLLSRFRCGSHSLNVEIGRFNKVPRNERLCSCGRGVKTVLHCFSDCPMTEPLLERRYNCLYDIFQDENICILLYKICNILKISI